MANSRSSYQQILRATSVIGAASLINVGFQVLRVKVLAVLLGPGGMGLFGMLNSILTTASSMAGLGVGSSAVRQIAEARGKADEARVGEIGYVLRVLSIGLGAVGAATLVVFREPISRLSFGDVSYSPMVGWLAIGVFLTVSGQSFVSLLQGYRRIGDQARLQVWSGAVATVLAIGAIAALGREGVIFFVVVMPLVAALLAWRYARGIGLRIRYPGAKPFFEDARRMIVMGTAIMASGTLQGWALLTLRSQITREMGIDATGLFQAAWALSFVYMGFVLDAMGKDYYPSLTEHVEDDLRTTQLMQEQVNVGIVLVGPLIIAMIAFAPLAIDLLYTRSFRDAVPLIQWMGLGNLLKVVSWPLGFLLLAKARTGAFLLLEVTWTASLLGVAWWCRQAFGLSAVGIAFIGSYVLTLVILFFVVRSINGFGFSKENIRLASTYGLLVFVAYLAARHDLVIGYAVGLTALTLSAIQTYKKLRQMIGRDPIALLRDKLTKKN